MSDFFVLHLNGDNFRLNAVILIISFGTYIYDVCIVYNSLLWIIIRLYS